MPTGNQHAYAMGTFFDKDTFSAEDRELFSQKLQQQLEELKCDLAKPSFSIGEATLGAELETYLVDFDGQPSCVNQQIIDHLNHPQMQQELNRYNLEVNLSPVAAKGTPFTLMDAEIRECLDLMHQGANHFGAQVVPIGILPTLTDQHLSREFLTDLPRYRALTNEISAIRGEPFKIHIQGKDTLTTQCDEVTLEGANTSFQLHFKVPANRFTDYYNAAQCITPLVLAVAGNSPLFLGQQLWQETRIALFKQSIDNRIRSLTQWRQPARVTYGQGWLREGAWELFAENVALFPPILPYIDPTGSPYAELTLHHGTVWSWNRAVLQPGNDPHVRIEFRTLPAGPTVIDMLANAALTIGLTVTLSEQMEDLLPRLPFAYAEYNFYRCAQSGLGANVLWPYKGQQQLEEVPVTRVLENLLPLAVDGLRKLGVDDQEASRYIAVIEERLQTGQTGSNWQLKRLNHYQQRLSLEKSLAAMQSDYIHNVHGDLAVAKWDS